MAKVNVSYSRLFNIGEYENEKITIGTEVDEENADKEIGELFMKVLDIEKMFERYRRALNAVETAWRYVENSKHDVSRTEIQIENKKVKIHEIAQLLEKQTIDQDEAADRRLRSACDAHTLRELKRQLELNRERLAKNKAELGNAQKIQKEIENRISNGNFSLEGIEESKHTKRDLIF